jgi:hypothetical protein
VPAEGLVLDRLQQVLGQQRLVHRRGDLGDEDLVAGVDVGLVLARQLGVQRVAQLVGQRVHRGDVVLEVHQDVRLAVVGAAGVGPRALVGGLVHVDPARIQPLRDPVLVVLAQRRHRLDHVLAGLLV